MTESEYDRGHLVRLDDGSFVERDVLNIVEKLREYDPNLRVQYLAHAAAVGDAPYRIVETCRDGKDRVVFYVWQLDDTVLERIYLADTQRVDVLAALDRNNAAVRRSEARYHEEEREKAQDLVKSVLRSKGRYTFKRADGKIVEVDDDPNRKHRVR